MNSFNLRIGQRLALGFGLLIALLGAISLIAMQRFSSLGEINQRIIQKDWVKAEASSVINATTRANARRTMELLIASSPEEVAQINAKVDANKKIIDEAFSTLDDLVYLPAGKALLATIKEKRGRYVASFTKIRKLVASGHHDEAVGLMKAETLPALDALQQPITALTQLQKDVVAGSGAQAQQHIDSARQLILGMGAFAFVFGVVAARWITRSITRPIADALGLAQKVAAGDLTGRVDAHSRDEVGHLLVALQTMNGSLVRIVGDFDRDQSDRDRQPRSVATHRRAGQLAAADRSIA